MIWGPDCIRLFMYLSVNLSKLCLPIGDIPAFHNKKHNLNPGHTLAPTPTDQCVSAAQDIVKH